MIQGTLDLIQVAYHRDRAIKVLATVHHELI